jgi:hypothetical protein
MAGGESFRMRSTPLYREEIQGPLVQHGCFSNYSRGTYNSIFEESSRQSTESSKRWTKTLRVHIISWLRTSSRCSIRVMFLLRPAVNHHDLETLINSFLY